MAGSPQKRARIRELEEENKRLRAGQGTLVFQHGSPFDVPIADELRDQMAAKALVENYGDPFAALRAMGVDIDTMEREAVKELANRVFNNDRIRNLIAPDIRKVTEQRDNITRRQIQIALTAGPEDSSRAAGWVAKVLGWIAPTKIQTSTKSINVHAMITNPELMAAMNELTHEPGEASAVYSEVVDERLALESGDEDGA